MSVTVTYGGYTHPAGEVFIEDMGSFNIHDARGNVDRIRAFARLRGVLKETGTALAAKVTDIKAVYIDRLTLEIKKDNVLIFSMPSIGAFEGPSTTLTFPMSPGAAHLATGVPFRVSIEAIYPAAVQFNLMEYSDSLTYQGTGQARYIPITPDSGPMVVQRVSESTPIAIMQQGFAITRSVYKPVVPFFSTTVPTGSVFPLPDQMIETRVTPIRQQGVLSGYRSSWTLRWISSAPIPIANPRVF